MMIFRPAGLMPEKRCQLEMVTHVEPEEAARLEEPVVAAEVDPGHANEG
jgi:hypothetical protein